MMMIVAIELTDEVAEAKTKDPIITFGAYLKETGVMDDNGESK